MLLALTTGHKIGLLTFAAIFICFALLSAFVLPRVRPQFPGRGLPLFVLTTIGLFAAMLTAVIVFGREGKEAEARNENPTKTTEGPTGAKSVVVDETEFKITLPGGSTLKAGSYDFEAKNTGKLGHDLVVVGPGVDNEKTPVYDPGQTETLKVTLQPGTYDLYCSVPGHKQAGMDLKLTVS
ncbi:MAG TPA: plastocyanin/azurin family copper-binding protein [Gaiellaceae bacterium]